MKLRERCDWSTTHFDYFTFGQGPLSEGMSWHMAGENSCMTLPVLKSRIHYPVDGYYIDYANPIPILSGFQADTVPLCFITTYFMLCVRNMLPFCI